MTAATKRPAAKPGHSRDGGDRNQRASEIMDAALHLFAENGVSRVTIKDIGRACDLNAAMIYYYPAYSPSPPVSSMQFSRVTPRRMSSFISICLSRYIERG